jgi:hypothetical protein
MRKQPRYYDETSYINYGQNYESDQAHSQPMPVIPSAVLAQVTVPSSQYVTLSSPRVVSVIEVQPIGRGAPRTQDKRPAFRSCRYYGIICERGVGRRAPLIAFGGAGSDSRSGMGRRTNLDATDVIWSRITCHGGLRGGSSRPVPQRR